MPTTAEKYMRKVIDKRIKEITQTGQEIDGPRGEAMETAIEIYGDIHQGRNHIQRQALLPNLHWSAMDIAGEIANSEELAATLDEVIGALFRNPGALAVAINTVSSQHAAIFRQLSDLIEAGAGQMCADLSIEKIINENGEHDA